MLIYSPYFGQSGADINAKDMLKMTALHWATEHGHRGVVELLVKYGADTHALSKFDKTPFNISVDRGNTDLMLLLQVLKKKGKKMTLRCKSITSLTVAYI